MCRRPTARARILRDVRDGVDVSMSTQASGAVTLGGERVPAAMARTFRPVWWPMVPSRYAVPPRPAYPAVGHRTGSGAGRARTSTRSTLRQRSAAAPSGRASSFTPSNARQTSFSATTRSRGPRARCRPRGTRPSPRRRRARGRGGGRGAVDGARGLRRRRCCFKCHVCGNVGLSRLWARISVSVGIWVDV